MNGRKLNLISIDQSGYSPPKTVEQTRRLVERGRDRLHFRESWHAVQCRHSLLSQRQQGAATAYLHGRQNHVLRRSAALSPGRWATSPTIKRGAYLRQACSLATMPDAKIGVLYQNDGVGEDYLIGLRAGLGVDHAAMIVKEVSYEGFGADRRFASRHPSRLGYRRARHRHRRPKPAARTPSAKPTTSAGCRRAI